MKLYLAVCSALLPTLILLQAGSLLWSADPSVGGGESEFLLLRPVPVAGPAPRSSAPQGSSKRSTSRRNLNP